MTDPNPKNQQTPITSFTRAKWQTVTKKRKITQSPPSPAGVLTADNNATKTKPIITSNKYAVLAEPTTNIVSDNITSVEITNTTSSIKKILPPPIFVKGVNNHKAMIDNVLQIIPTEHLSTKSLTNNSVKINVTDIESYRKLTKEFRKHQPKTTSAATSLSNPPSVLATSVNQSNRTQTHHGSSTYAQIVSSNPVNNDNDTSMIKILNKMNTQFEAIYTQMRDLYDQNKQLMTILLKGLFVVLCGMEWNEENTIELIKLYESKEILWNQKHSHYYNKILKNDAWNEVAIAIKISIDECKKENKYAVIIDEKRETENEKNIHYLTETLKHTSSQIINNF
ncbi:hypothetical protein PGB90_000011 [Kerria lacca]